MNTISDNGIRIGPMTGMATQRARVLVVDDDRAIRDLVRCVLELEDYEVTCARDGRDALALLLAAPAPWVVLMDVMMPLVSGIEVCHRLGGVESPAANHRIALMTAGLLEEGDCPAQVRALIRKPFNVDHLLAVVGMLAADLAASELPAVPAAAPEMAATLA